MEKRPRPIKPVLRSFCTLILLIYILVACAPTPATLTQQTPEQTLPVATPTPEPTPTATALPTYQVNEPEEQFSDAQSAINASPSAQEQKEMLQTWLDYWVIFDNRPFALNSTELRWKYIYDNYENPTEVLTVLEAGGEYGCKLFTVPVANDDWQRIPPGMGIGQTDIGVNFGPLELSGGDYVLSVQEGIPVRRDVAGRIMESLDMKTGQWKKESLIEGNIFFDPQSEADFDKVVESPSPIDDPQNFAKWQDEYLKMIEEKLKTYNGFFINGQSLGIIYSSDLFSVGSENWPVVAAYKFVWKGQEILTKTFVFKDGQENLIPVSLTYSNFNSLMFNSDLGYVTPKNIRAVFTYAWSKSLREAFSEEFVEDFLPINNEDLDSQRRGFFGSGDLVDREILSRSRFVIGWEQ